MSTTMLRDVRQLSIDTEYACCPQVVENEYINTFYSNPRWPLSIVEFPDTGDEYAAETCSKVARYNARRCVRHGYHHRIIDRADWEDDLWKIRRSKHVRQGRRMPIAYLERQAYGHDFQPLCVRHGSTVHGVVHEDGHLYAYCQLVQCGEITRVNTILGHWERLDDGVMWLLMLEAFKWHIDRCQSRYGLYYTHQSGHGPGLRYWKERFGMRPTKVTWVL